MFEVSHQGTEKQTHCSRQTAGIVLEVSVAVSRDSDSGPIPRRRVSAEDFTLPLCQTLANLTEISEGLDRHDITYTVDWVLKNEVSVYVSEKDGGRSACGLSRTP